MSVRSFDPVSLEILWSRLVALVEESVTALIRVAFSPSVREANDHTCALMDAQGSALAQSLVSTPLHTGVKSFTMRALLRKYALDAWQPGDAAISNDPWIGTGQRNDVTIARPIFHRGKVVGFAVNDTHWPDIGGPGLSAENRDVFEEGLGIPNCKILRAGKPVEEVFEFIRLNTRLPEQTLGDLHAQLVAAERLAHSVSQLLAEEDLPDLAGLAQAIYERSERAMRAAIATLRPGSYESEIDTDGYDEPIHLRARLEVQAASIHVDYSGSSPQSRRALNSVWNYTYAWTVFALKGALDPETPNNDACLRPFAVTAPEGSVLNPRWGAPVGVRNMTGHYLPSLVLRALALAAPERVIAESGSPPHRSVIMGKRADGQPFGFTFNASGGLGAGPANDGLHCTAFPTNTTCTPIEVLERSFPLLFWRRELIPDSGGAGRQRGGCGQRIVVEYTGTEPVAISPRVEHMRIPPAGLVGGLPGAVARMTRNGEVLHPKARFTCQPGEQLEIRTAGGGGYGPPAERALPSLEADVRDGVVTREAATELYGQTRAPRDIHR